MSEKTMLSVKAIKNGTVIDHIPAGQGLHILHHFHLDQSGNCVTVGFNLSSRHRTQCKDLIKIEGQYFSDHESNLITLFAPQATINIIENFQVIKKIKPSLPETIRSIFACPNTNCATHGEPVESFFFVKIIQEIVHLKCFYCEKNYPITWVIHHSNIY